MLSGFQAEECTRLPGGLIKSLMAGALSHSFTCRKAERAEKSVIKLPGETDLILWSADEMLTECSLFGFGEHTSHLARLDKCHAITPLNGTMMVPV